MNTRWLGMHCEIRWCRTLCIWIYLFGALSCVHGGSPNRPPNVLLILADNWRYPHAGAYGDALARTPAFDRMAREGMLFTHAFNPVPSCSPTRSCLLTGKYAHQLGARASLYSDFPKDTPVVTDLLSERGYVTGYAGKGWGPGNFEVSGWQQNPVGRRYDSFSRFMEERRSDDPFFFWLGNTDTATKGGKHPYLDEASKFIRSDQVVVPPELPDCPEVRDDLLNYYGGIMRLDAAATEAIALLETRGELEQTVVIYTSDNGWQLPRGLANCYDSGSRVPMAIRWPGHIPEQSRCDAFINIAELGPTILQLAGIRVPAEMSFQGFVARMLGKPDADPRDHVFIERERHADVRQDHLSYPMRAVRTKDYLYIRNLRPDRWPAGDPDVFFLHGRPYGDVDTTAVKDYLLAHLDDPASAECIQRIFAKRPPEELYDLRADPHQMHNVIGETRHASTLAELRAQVDAWMRSTGDPRIDPEYDEWDRFTYYGKPAK